MITKIQLYQHIACYDYAMIRIWRNKRFKDYNFDSKRWNQLLKCIGTSKRKGIEWYWHIYPNGVDHTRIDHLAS